MPLVNKNFADIITFSRASAAWRYNSAGVLVQAAAGESRFDYDPVTKVAKGMLIEEQRTNLLLNSRDPSLWPTKTNITFTQAAGAALDGANRAVKVEATAAAASDLNSGSIVVASTAVTEQFAVKKGNVSTLSFVLRNNTTATNLVGASVNMDTLAVTYTTGASGASAVALSSGYVLVTLAATAGITSGDSIVAYCGFQGNVQAAGDHFFYSDGQVEIGGFGTSLMPTAGAQVTRAADVARINVLSPWYNPYEGTFVIEIGGKANNKLSFPVHLRHLSLGNTMAIQVNAANGAGLYVIDGGVLQANTSSAGPLGKIAFAYKANNFGVCGGGGSVAEDTAGTVPTVERLTLGSSDGSSAFINDHIKNLRYIPRRVSNAELQSLTA